MTAPERGTATPVPELARRVGHAAARSLAAAGRSIRPNILPCARPSFDGSATLSRKRTTRMWAPAHAGAELDNVVSPVDPADYAIDAFDFLPA